MTDPEGDADRAEMDAQMDALDIKVGLAAEAHRFRTAGPERWPGGSTNAEDASTPTRLAPRRWAWTRHGPGCAEGCR